MQDREPVPGKLELLDLSFYKQSSLILAPALVGCVIETNKGGTITSGRITEVEAYPGFDPASHAYKKEPTGRTKVQYQEGGRLYVYQVMGLHMMVSIVVNEENLADVVFIRSIEPIHGIEVMRTRRNYFSENLRGLASGPGMLSVALGISKSDNGVVVYAQGSQIKIYKDPEYQVKVESGVRINLGTSKLSNEEAKKAISEKWRFYIPDSVFLSK